MTCLPAIIRATRASANAVKAIDKLNREIRHAERTMAWNARMMERGYMTSDAARTDDAICAADITRAMEGIARTSTRYMKAREVLAANPL